MCSSDLRLQVQSGREEEEEEFVALDQDNSQIIIPRELIRNLNMTEGGSRVCVHRTSTITANVSYESYI